MNAANAAEVISSLSIQDETARRGNLLLALPDDVLHIILNDLQGRDVMRLASTSRTMRRIFGLDTLWQTLYKRDFPTGPHLPLISSSPPSSPRLMSLARPASAASSSSASPSKSIGSIVMDSGGGAGSSSSAHDYDDSKAYHRASYWNENQRRRAWTSAKPKVRRDFVQADGKKSAVVAAQRDRPGRVSSIAFFPGNGRTPIPMIATSGQNKFIRIMNVSNAQVTGQLEGHAGEVNLLLSGKENGKLWSVSKDHTVKLWQDNKCKMTLEGHTRPIHDALLSDSKKWMATGGVDGNIRLHDTQTGHCIRTYVGHADVVEKLLMDDAETMIVSASYDTSVRVWPIPSVSAPPEPADEDDAAAVAGAPQQPDHRVLGDHRSLVSGLSWLENGRLLASSCWDKGLRLWKVHPFGSKPAAQEEAPSLLWTFNHKQSISFVHKVGANRLITGSDDTNLHLFDATRGQRIEILKGHRGAVKKCLVRADDDFVVVSCNEKDGRVLVHDIRIPTKAAAVIMPSEGCTVPTALARNDGLMASDSIGGDILAVGYREGVFSLMDFRKPNAPPIVKIH